MMSDSFKLKNDSVLLVVDAPAGIYNPDQLKQISEIASHHGMTVKVTEEQRISMIVPEEKVSGLSEAFENESLPVRTYKNGRSQPVSCMGGLCPFSQQDAVSAALDIASKASSEAGPEMTVGINGCASTCVPTHTLDLNIMGEETGYRVSIGGKNTYLPEMASYLAEGVPEAELSDLVENTYELFLKLRQDDETLGDVIERVGSSQFVDLFSPYSQDAAGDGDPFGMDFGADSSEEVGVEVGSEETTEQATEDLAEVNSPSVEDQLQDSTSIESGSLGSDLGELDTESLETESLHVEGLDEVDLGSDDLGSDSLVAEERAGAATNLDDSLELESDAVLGASTGEIELSEDNTDTPSSDQSETAEETVTTEDVSEVELGVEASEKDLETDLEASSELEDTVTQGSTELELDSVPTEDELGEDIGGLGLSAVELTKAEIDSDSVDDVSLDDVELDDADLDDVSLDTDFSEDLGEVSVSSNQGEASAMDEVILDESASTAQSLEKSGDLEEPALDFGRGENLASAGSEVSSVQVDNPAEEASEETLGADHVAMNSEEVDFSDADLEGLSIDDEDIGELEEDLSLEDADISELDEVELGDVSEIEGGKAELKFESEEVGLQTEEEDTKLSSAAELSSSTPEAENLNTATSGKEAKSQSVDGIENDIENDIENMEQESLEIESDSSLDDIDDLEEPSGEDDIFGSDEIDFDSGDDGEVVLIDDIEDFDEFDLDMSEDEIATDLGELESDDLPEVAADNLADVGQLGHKDEEELSSPENIETPQPSSDTGEELTPMLPEDSEITEAEEEDESEFETAFGEDLDNIKATSALEDKNEGARAEAVEALASSDLDLSLDEDDLRDDDAIDEKIVEGLDSDLDSMGDFSDQLPPARNSDELAHLPSDQVVDAGMGSPSKNVAGFDIVDGKVVITMSGGFSFELDESALSSSQTISIAGHQLVIDRTDTGVSVSVGGINVKIPEKTAA